MARWLTMDWGDEWRQWHALNAFGVQLGVERALGEGNDSLRRRLSFAARAGNASPSGLAAVAMARVYGVQDCSIVENPRGIINVRCVVDLATDPDIAERVRQVIEHERPAGMVWVVRVIIERADH